MIDLKVTRFPEKAIVATCRDCGKEIWRQEWETYGDYQRKRSLARKLYKKCPLCGAKATNKEERPTLKWERHIDIYGRTTRSWEAKAEKGDFLVWKCGRIWKGRYRVYGSDKPVMLGFASTLEGIKQRCERSEYWPKAQ